MFAWHVHMWYGDDREHVDWRNCQEGSIESSTEINDEGVPLTGGLLFEIASDGSGSGRVVDDVESSFESN